MIPYLDFHTHAEGCKKYLEDKDVIVIQSLHLGEKVEPRANFATWGVHPMLEGTKEFVDQLRQDREQLISEWYRTLSLTPKLIGVGECGWDNRSPLSLEEQELLVDFHIALADQLGYPLIFHIVGGWHHLLAKKKSHSKSEVPWIVHGFRGSAALAKQLTSAGIFLSLHPYCSSGVCDKYFLETDDTPMAIESHYRARDLLHEEQRQGVINLFCGLFPVESQLITVHL